MDYFMGLSAAFDEYKHKDFDKDLCSQAGKILSYKFEMEVGLFFKKHEIQTRLILQKTPDGKGVPDLLLCFPEAQKLWVECVAPEKGRSSDYAVPDVDTTKPTPCHERQSLSRLADALCGSYNVKTEQYSDGKISQYIKRLNKRTCLNNDLYLIAISGADLDLCLKPQFLLDVFANDVSEFLSGEPLFIKKNSQIDGDDFESGILGLGCPEGSDQTQQVIRPFKEVPAPENLGIILFVNGKQTFPDPSDCCLFCISGSPFMEIAEKMQVPSKIVRMSPCA